MKFIRSAFSPLYIWIGVALLVVGCPFFGIGAYEAVEAQQEAKSFIPVTGTVIDNSYQTTYNDGIEEGAYYPVVDFATSTGERVRFTDGSGSLPPDYEVGAAVPVLYNPADPHDARLNTWKRIWFVPTLLMGIGGLPFLVFAGWVFVSSWKSLRGINV